MSEKRAKVLYVQTQNRAIIYSVEWWRLCTLKNIEHHVFKYTQKCVSMCRATCIVTE